MEINMKIYGTHLCSECDKAEIKLKELGIEYEYINFTDSIFLLKEFTKFRDTHKEFEHIKGTGKIGIPCFVFENDEIIFNLEKAIEKAKKE